MSGRALQNAADTTMRGIGHSKFSRFQNAKLMISSCSPAQGLQSDRSARSFE